jgi:predicted phage terminase large subunit-like protein
MTRVEYKDWIRRSLAAAEKTDTTREVMRELTTSSLFYVLTRVLKRKDADRDWIYERCLEVQENPDGYLDIWAREHYKSTIITFALTIQEIIKDPELKAVIYSFNRPTAKAFLRQIKTEFETNATLKWLFPEIFYEDPKKESPRWSEDAGLLVKRKGNPKEATLEAYGLVDGQPTGKHYSLMIYDDVVTKDSVTNAEMIDKVTYAWEMSLNTGSEGCRKRYVGTRYHYADTYKVMMDRGVAELRLYPCIKEGQSILFSEDYIAEKKKAMGSYTFACQMMCDPKEDGSIGFLEKDLRYWDAQKLDTLNTYILIDPANAKKKKSDYTSIWVVGLGSDQNYYVMTMIRDKLSLTERTRVLFTLHRQYRPLMTFYERYGMQTDIEHIQYVQEQTNYRFGIQEFGGTMAKEDRILDGLQPIFEAHRMYLPNSCIRTNYEHKREDLVQVFIRDEYLAFPFCIHDDMLDGLARVADEEVSKSMIFPDPVSVMSVIEQSMGFHNGDDDSLADYDPFEGM